MENEVSGDKPEETSSMPQLVVAAESLKATRINKMVMHGFKSFAKHTEILFGPNFNCVLGPNGAGKSCHPDTEVILGDGSARKIGELVEKELSKSNRLSKMDDGVYCENKSEISVLTLNPRTLKIEDLPVGAFVRRSGEETLYRITTNRGKSVVATGCHPVMVFKNGSVQPELVSKLAIGSLIAAPRLLPIEGTNAQLPDASGIRSQCKVDENIAFPKYPTKLFARWLGMLIGDGYIRNERIEFVNGEQSLVDEWITLTKNIFNAPDPYVRKTGNAYRVIFHSRKIPFFLEKLFEKPIKPSLTSASKDIPRTIMQADNSVIAGLISGIIDTDGYVSSKRPTIEFACKNPRLAEQMQLLLLRFGILSKKALSWKHATNTKNKSKMQYARLFIEGTDNFERFASIGVLHSGKKQRIEAWLARNVAKNPNADILPREVNGIIRNASQLLGLSSKKLRVQYPNFAAYIENRCCPSRYGLQRVLDLMENKWNILAGKLNSLRKEQRRLVQALHIANIPMRRASISLGLSPQLISDYWATGKFNATEENLDRFYSYVKEELQTRLFNADYLMGILGALAQSEIAWESIAAIDKIPGTEYVYDLSIIGNHNFIANNIFVHNSNVLDSLCFVLGKSSSRDLRAEKSANLIYNGGKAKKPAKQGEVSIYFDNISRVFPTEDKEVKITRIVRESGQSIYKINDKAMTRQQVTNLLSLAKIDPDGYNIILQGDIVKFVEMHPEDRRKLIEDIAGISIYEEKKHKAMLELEKVEQHLRETEIILTERGTYLKELKKDRDQALKYKDMSDRIKCNKASYLKIQIDRKESEKNGIQDRIDLGNRDLAAVREKISRLKSENEEKKRQIESISKEIEEKGEVEQLNLNREVEALKIELTKNNSRIETCRNEVSKLKQRREDLKDSIADIENRISQLSSEKKELEARIQSNNRDRESINAKILNFKEKHNIGNLGEIEKKVEEVDRKADELQKDIGSLREGQHNLIREKDRLSHDISIIGDRIKKVIDIEKENKQQLDAVKEKRQHFKSMTLELNKCLDEDSSLAIQLSESRRKANSANEELAKLRAKDITIKEFARGDLAVRKILELKGKKSGIYGTVADLGNVSSKYAVALEVAAGPRIKSIVVENEKMAAELIRYLKENKLGTATFLPMNKLSTRDSSDESKKLIGAKGVHDFAINLVSYDQKFKKVFSYVFSDTIIIDNIDVATRLGIGKAKFVTLDGDIAEVSGAMHGGFREKRKEAFGFKEREVADALEENEKRLADLSSLIDILEKRRTENESRITELREKKAELEGDIIKSEASMHLEASDTESSMEQQKSLQAKEKEADSQISSISNKIAEHNKELTSLKIEKQKLRNDIAQLNNPTLLAELNTFEQKFKELSEEVIRIGSEIKSIDAQIINIFIPEKDKTEKILKQIGKDEENFTSELTKVRDSIAQKESTLKEKEELAKEFYSKFKGLFARQGKINEEIQRNELSIDKLIEESRQVEIKVNFNSLKNAEIIASLAALSQEFFQYEGVKLDLEKSEEELKSEISKFERMREDIGSVNMRALDVYDEAERQYNEFLDKKEKLGKEKDDVVMMMNEIEGKKKGLFMKTFEIVNSNFKNFFGMLTTKGAEATMVIENEENPFEAGVRINVKITGSKFLDIRGLSGGEKTLTALAFIFAIQEHEPASFYVLDEVDAALDKHNSERLAKLIRQYAERAQYIMISHNDNVISTADILYGVSMNEDGISQVVSLKM
ncbi:chromosome segregation protein SMC [Candidatus Woesearchaeota archaeon]|nr:chromosome segregation protein SMC [Candidatus Woesearchaeota archaeon]